MPEGNFYKNFYMGPGSGYESRKAWETFFLMFGQLFHKYTEDHQDFLNGFLADLSVHLKKVANKRFKHRDADAAQLDDLDDDLSQLDQSLAKH